MTYTNYGIKPDIVSMAKGLGGGMPIGAIGAHTIRMVPPLIVSEEECDKAFEILDETVKSI